MENHNAPVLTGSINARRFWVDTSIAPVDGTITIHGEHEPVPAGVAVGWIELLPDAAPELVEVR
jgi:hypothetical protein